MFKLKLLLQNHHAAVGINDASVGFDGNALSGVDVPFQADGNPGVHPAAAALIIVAPAYWLGFTRLNLHFSL
jgi:hypothetical protein